jgi:hypothetical protein
MPGFKLARADGGYAVVVGVGTAQGGAASIVEATNLLPSETAQTGFVLPAKHPIGSLIFVKVGTVAATVFPASGGKIDNAAADAVRSVAAGKSAVFVPLDDGSTVTNWLCVVSA